VSRVHARFVGGDPATIEDLGSSNGTRVAGVALVAHRPTPVRPAQVIELGSVLVVYQNGRTASEGAPVLPGVASAVGPMESVDRLVALVVKSALSVRCPAAWRACRAPRTCRDQAIIAKTEGEAFEELLRGPRRVRASSSP
jgi:pSer/pThr/pTyr-binding forkhead associated (FHA) protein